MSERRRAERLAVTRPATLMVFDLLRLSGSALTAQPARRAASCSTASTSMAGTGRCRRDEDGEELLGSWPTRSLRALSASDAWCCTPPAAGLRTGARPPTARACRSSSAAARGGRVLGPRRRARGLPDGDGGWRYAGRVGAGRRVAGEALALRLRPLRRDTPPFADDVPSIDAPARPGSSRGWSSTSARSSAPGSTGSASRLPRGRSDLTPDDLDGGRRCLSTCPR